MGTRPNENWEARTIDSRSPKFRIDVANPEMGAEGADVYKIYAVTDNNDVNLCSLSEGGKYKIHNDKSIEIVAGMTNTEGGVDIVIAGMKGDVLITAMRDGQVKIKGANIVLQADEDIDLIAGRNINIKAHHTQHKQNQILTQPKSTTDLGDVYGQVHIQSAGDLQNKLKYHRQ